MNKLIKIFYNPHETGPAELLGRRLARIINVPLLDDELLPGDVVRLDRGPRDLDGYPRIAKIVSRRFPARTSLWFDDPGEAMTLHAVLALLGAECHVIHQPHQGRPGEMVVGHHADLDPVALADAVGIEQPTEREDAPPPGGGKHTPIRAGKNNTATVPVGDPEPLPADGESASKKWLNQTIHEICRQQGFQPFRVAMASFLHFVENAASRSSLLERLDEAERAGLFHVPNRPS